MRVSGGRVSRVIEMFLGGMDDLILEKNISVDYV